MASSLNYGLQKESDISATIINESSVLVNEEGNTSLINVEKSGMKTIITVKDLATSESYYFVKNEKDNTLYSSLTGYTGSLEDFQKNEYSTAQATQYDYISYRTLAAYVGIGAGASVILSSIIAIVGSAGSASNVLGLISGILTVINGGIALADSNSGLKITSKQEERTKHQGGGVIIYYVYIVTNVSRY